MCTYSFLLPVDESERKGENDKILGIASNVSEDGDTRGWSGSKLISLSGLSIRESVCPQSRQSIPGSTVHLSEAYPTFLVSYAGFGSVLSWFAVKRCKPR